MQHTASHSSEVREEGRRSEAAVFLPVSQALRKESSTMSQIDEMIVTPITTNEDDNAKTAKMPPGMNLATTRASVGAQHRRYNNQQKP